MGLQEYVMTQAQSPRVSEEVIREMLGSVVGAAPRTVISGERSIWTLFTCVPPVSLMAHALTCSPF